LDCIHSLSYLEIIRVASAVSRSIEDLCNKSTIFTMQYARSYYGKRSKLHGSYFQPGVGIFRATTNLTTKIFYISPLEFA
jgi:hypothetical protein